MRAHSALSIGGNIAEAEQKYAEACDSYEVAIHAWNSYGDIFEHAHALLGLARCLIALGDREAATEPLHKARAIFSSLGALPLVSDRHLPRPDRSGFLGRSPRTTRG